MGDFTTGSSTGTTASVTLPYTGSGYPIMALIVIAGGAYNNTESGNTTWYNSTQRYAIGQWTYSKSNMTTTPTYGTSGAANYGVTTAIYKNSTSTATTYTRTSAMNTLVLTSTAPTAAGSTCCRFSSKTVLNYFIAASSYGLMASTKYTYFIVYSS